jgi:hypothetical protein
MKTFRAGNADLETFVLESIKRYSLSFRFNIILSIVARLKGSYDRQHIYARSDLHVGLTRSAILNEWEKQSLETMLQTRLLATFISQNTTFEHYLKVFRGVVDKRQKKRVTTTLSKEMSFLENISRLKDVEDFVKIRLKNPSLVQTVVEVILDGSGFEGLIDQHPFQSEEMEIEVMNYVKASNIEFNDLVDNDTDILSKLEVGEQYQCKNFLSTSLLKSHSEKFFEPGICCFLEIIVPAHSNMFYISPFSSFSFDEEERYNVTSDEFEVVQEPPLQCWRKRTNTYAFIIKVPRRKTRISKQFWINGRWCRNMNV